MQTIAITPPATLPYEHDWAAALLHAGLYRLHVRRPDFTECEMAGYLAPLVEMGLAPRLALHSHYSLAAQFGIPHLHITGRSRGLPLPAECCECTLSTSIHTLREVLDLRSTPYRYAFLLSLCGRWLRVRSPWWRWAALPVAISPSSVRWASGQWRP